MRRCHAAVATLLAVLAAMGCGDEAGATHDYEIVGLDKQKTPDYFDTLKKWWMENGYSSSTMMSKTDFSA